MPAKYTSKRYSKTRSRVSRALAYSRYGKKGLGLVSRYMRDTTAPIPSRVPDVRDYASCSCSVALLNPVVNQVYQFNTLDLSSFDRAVQIARAYQMYRITKLTLHFRPTFDTYAPNGGSSKMNLYYVIDKSGSIPPNPTLVALRSMGAKAFQLDEKVLDVSWAPSVLDAALQVAPANNNASQYKISPWLSTSANIGGAWAPSTIDHLGITFCVEQLFTPQVTTYELEVEAQFEFKKPLWPVQGNGDAAKSISLEALMVPNNTPTTGDEYVGAGAGGSASASASMGS